MKRMRRMILFLICTVFLIFCFSLHAAEKPVPPAAPKKAPSIPSQQTPAKTFAPMPAGPATPPPPPQPGSLNVIKPQQGDVLTQGTNFLIQWGTQGQVTDNCYQLYLFQGPSLVHTVTLQTQPPSYSWTVPTIFQGGNFRIRVSNCSKTLSADSAAFPIVSNKPDLSITDLSISPQQPDTTDQITIKAKVANAGQAGVLDEAALKLRITAPDGTFREFSENLPKMFFGDHKTITKSIAVSRKGQYTVTASVPVRFLNGSDGNPADNTRTTQFTVKGLPDLIVCGPFHYYIPVNSWSELTLEVVNYGDEPSPPYTVHVWMDGKGTQTFNYPGLQPAARATIPYHFSILKAEDRDYWAYVDQDNVIRERREDNNKQTGVVTASDQWRNHQPPDKVCSGNWVRSYEIYERP